METLSGVIGWASGALFVALTFICLSRWRSDRSSAAAWIGATFGMLAIVLVMARVIPEDQTGPGALWIIKLLIILLVLFPYFLFRFMAAINSASRALEIVAAALTAVVVVATLTLVELSGPEEPRSTSIQIYLVLLVAQFVGLTMVVALRAYRSGVGQPTIVRKRMRLLGLGALAIGAALILAAVPSGESPSRDLVVQLFVVASALMFFMGFSPPAALRTVWRRQEQALARQATVELMSATSTEEIAESMLPHVIAVTGGRAAALLDSGGDLVAGNGVTPELERSLRERAPGADSQILRLEFPFGSLVVWTTPYTPFFGRDEVELVSALMTLTNAAIERGELQARERRARGAMEKTSMELESATTDLQFVTAERRRTEEELIESQIQLAEAQEITQLGSWSWEVESDHVIWSDHLYRIYGVEPQSFDATFEGFLGLVHPDDREQVRAAVESLFGEEESFDIDHRIIRPDGGLRVMHARGKVIRGIDGKPVKMIGTGQDITRSMQAEEELRASEMRFRNLAQSASDAIISADSNGCVVFWNRGAQETFGYWEEEVVGQPLTMLMPERFREDHLNGFERYLTTGQSNVIGSTLELAGLHKDGTEFPLELSLATWEADGEQFFTGILRDVSARRSTERELERVSRYNELILNAIGDGICGVGPDGVVQFINPAGARMLGYEVTELVGMPHEVFHRCSASAGDPNECGIQRASAEGVTQRGGAETFWRKDGAAVATEIVAAPIFEEAAIAGAVVLFRGAGIAGEESSGATFQGLDPDQWPATVPARGPGSS